MLVYKCPICGVTYSKNEVPRSEICPSCATYLKIVDVNPGAEQVETGSQTINIGRTSSVGRIPFQENRNIAEAPFAEKYERGLEYSENTEGCLIEGTVISASSDTGYRRHSWEKLYYRYFYSQNVSDSQNSIHVRCIEKDGSVINKRIVIYGQIKGGIGIIRTGMKIKGEGKYNRQNEFIAKRLIVEDSINVSVRTEPGDVLYYMYPLLFALFLFVLFNFVGIAQGILQSVFDSTYLKWILIGMAGLYVMTYHIIGRVIRLPIINRIRASAWISVFLGAILFFIFKGVFLP